MANFKVTIKAIWTNTNTGLVTGDERQFDIQAACIHGATLIARTKYLSNRDVLETFDDCKFNRFSSVVVTKSSE